MSTRILTRVDGGTEELAAREIGDGHFVIDSVPFIDTTIALGDIVSCVLIDGRFHVDAVTVRGGNSTLRIVPHGIDVVSPLLGLGCRVDEGPAGLLAVSYGPDAPSEGLMEWLEGLADDGMIDLAPGYQV